LERVTERVRSRNGAWPSLLRLKRE
jgi:hypothetical protein